MVVSYHRPTKAIIHTGAITENIKNEKARLTKEQSLFAVVKANGYGHGAKKTAEAAVLGGADGFCVATLDEGIELRKAGFFEPILILGIVTPDYLELVSEYDLAIPIATSSWLKDAQVFLAANHVKKPIKVHIKIDTGMGRIGFSQVDEVVTAINEIKEESNFIWEGIFTHFATADDPSATFWKVQNERFNDVLAQLSEKPKYIHTSNSAAALWHEAASGNMIRYGIAMYGLDPSGGAMPHTPKLVPALELVSELCQVKQLEEGTGIGYGQTYTTSDKEWIGTVPIGYADGWLRKLQGFSVLVDGNYCEIVGRVCMDQIMVRLPGNYPVGTKVTLIGENNEKKITVQDVADYLGTINYEVVCTLSERVPREYIS